MSSVTMSGVRHVAKRNSSQPPAEDSPDGRVEFQAPVEWVERLDAAAKALGMSRSAYIRFACNRQMQADRKQEREGE